ncbi:LytR C-terminal domain-containing protein [Corynebacterium choanae]|uniref:LytR C-terminal domain-containing protein n=1 Tax=Corynebacterium choanae TaxID=1862358 RepID=UPI0013DE5BEB|nr:LytR C-terminal domain-containing protein [Corynebacterium choanae]
MRDEDLQRNTPTPQPRSGSNEPEVVLPGADALADLTAVPTSPAPSRGQTRDTQGFYDSLRAAHMTSRQEVNDTASSDTADNPKQNPAATHPADPAAVGMRAADPGRDATDPRPALRPTAVSAADDHRQPGAPSPHGEGTYSRAYIAAADEEDDVDRVAGLVLASDGVLHTLDGDQANQGNHRKPDSTTSEAHSLSVHAQQDAAPGVAGATGAAITVAGVASAAGAAGAATVHSGGAGVDRSRGYSTDNDLIAAAHTDAIGDDDQAAVADTTSATTPDANLTGVVAAPLLDSAETTGAEQPAGDEVAETDDTAGEDTTGGGLPLRGIAMVLIAAGVFFGAWALMTMGGGDTTDDAATTAQQSNSTNATTGAARGGQAAPQPTQPGQPPASQANTTPGAAAPRADEAAPGETPQQPTTPGDPAQPAAPAPGQPATAPGAPVDPVGIAAQRRVPVAVQNNSLVNGWANETADQLAKAGWTIGEVGNLPGYAFPETTVLFTPGNKLEEATAASVAAELGAVTAARDGDNPGMPPGVVVVLAGR